MFTGMIRKLNWLSTALSTTPLIDCIRASENLHLFYDAFGPRSLPTLN